MNSTEKIFGKTYIVKVLEDGECVTLREAQDVIYICDRNQCANCSPYCFHTTELDHALNFEKVQGGYVERGDNDLLRAVESLIAFMDTCEHPRRNVLVTPEEIRLYTDWGYFSEGLQEIEAYIKEGEGHE